MRRTKDELAKMRKAGRVVAEMHAKTREAIKPGVTTMQLDKIAREVIERRGARSNFLNYHGFPAVICTSPNDMIVHGIPSEKVVLQEGDIISIDCGAIIEGYHGDAAYTAPVGDISPEARKLIEVTEASLSRFFGMHVLVLPLLAGMFLVAHLTIVHQQGLANPTRPDPRPSQAPASDDAPTEPLKPRAASDSSS